MKSAFFTLTVICFLLTACSGKKSPEVVSKNTEKSTSEKYIFEGVLPCADCSGIKTTLSLDVKNFTDEGYAYELSQEYLGKESEKPFVEKGYYNLERGFEDDKDATVYVLNWKQNKDEKMYFVVFSTNANLMYKLDMEGHRIKSDLDYSLKKK